MISLLLLVWKENDDYPYPVHLGALQNSALSSTDTGRRKGKTFQGSTTAGDRAFLSEKRGKPAVERGGEMSFF